MTPAERGAAREVKALARQRTQVALANGELMRASKCERCAAPDGPGPARLHGHHEDYAHPLAVRWLCAPCHKRRHLEIEWSAFLEQYRSHALFPVLSGMPIHSCRGDVGARLGVGPALAVRLLRGETPTHEVALRIEHVTGVRLESRPSAVLGMPETLVQTRDAFDPSSWFGMRGVL